LVRGAVVRNTTIPQPEFLKRACPVSIYAS
jgi:hypothetical protein